MPHSSYKQDRTKESRLQLTQQLPTTRYIIVGQGRVAVVMVVINSTYPSLYLQDRIKECPTTMCVNGPSVLLKDKNYSTTSIVPLKLHITNYDLNKNASVNDTAFRNPTFAMRNPWVPIHQLPDTNPRTSSTYLLRHYIQIEEETSGKEIYECVTYIIQDPRSAQ